jgi:hypothetical protein
MASGGTKRTRKRKTKKEIKGDLEGVWREGREEFSIPLQREVPMILQLLHNLSPMLPNP